MSKTKTPFLSLGSSGTVGGVLTSQKSSGVTILRSTPKPTDPYSLAQAYQRWDYRDYAYLWTLLTNSQKQVYRTRASRYHITGFSLWMREHLKDLPDLAGRWHLDEKTGAIAHDSSRNLNHAVIIGATPTTGLIDGAFSFDGLNDGLNCGIRPSLINLTAKSVLFFFKAPAFTGTVQVLYYAGYWEAPYGDRIRLWAASNQIVISLRDPTGALVARNMPFTPNEWTSIGYSWDGTTVIFIKDGVEVAPSMAFAGPLACSAVGTFFGYRPTTEWYGGLLDHPTIWNRAIDLTEAKRHSERRYP